MVRNESSPNHDWQRSAPDDGKIGVFADGFSVRWTRTLNFAEGHYHFSTFSDDGVRVWVDGTRIINSWVSGGSQNHTGDIELSNGDHTIKIEYFENSGPAYFDISWEQTDPSSQVTMAIDSPAGGADVEGIVTVGGWAIDQASPSGTGVSQVHVYRDGTAGGGGVGLGVASYGGDRPDVAAVYGSQFRYSGYNFSWNSNTASLGDHTLYVYVYSTVSSSWSHYQRQVHVVDTTPPSQASSLRPNGWTGPYTMDNTPAFAWDAASDARGIAGYYIALNDWTPDGGYGNDWDIGNVTSWTVPDSAALADGSHFVAITSRDNTGLVNPTNTNTQGDAPYYEFIVDTVAPASTVATLPGTMTDPTFALTWSGSDSGSGIAAYDVQVRDGSDGTWQDWLVDTTKTSATFTGQAGHTYYFRCRAYDLAGNVEGWPNDDGDTYTCVERHQIFLPMVLRRMTSIPAPTNHSPITPFSPSPSDGATGRSVNISLSWTGGDPGGDDVTYDIYFEADDSTPDALICNDVTSTSCDPGTLSHDTRYYWRIVATDEHGATTTGPLWSFSTTAPFTGTPTPTSTPTHTPSSTPTPISTPTHTPSSTPTSTSTPTRTPIPTPLPTATPGAGWEDEIIVMTNQERANHGLPPLLKDDRLMAAAEGHSLDMALNDFYDYTGSDGSLPRERGSRQGYNWWTYGENLAAGEGLCREQDQSLVMQAWMNSPSHRDNILDPDFEDIGVGFVYDPQSTYICYWTVDFGAASN
jgi:uncharacterized protein YkwD